MEIMLLKLSASRWKGGKSIILWSEVLYLIGGLEAGILASVANLLRSCFLWYRH